MAAAHDYAGKSALLIVPVLGRDAVLKALPCNLEERTQNRARVVTAPDHTQSHRGRETLHRSVDHASPAEVSQGGWDERHAYPPATRPTMVCISQMSFCTAFGTKPAWRHASVTWP